MKKTLHIIPGWEETCRRGAYRKLAESARLKEYDVVFHDIDWKKPLSRQVFAVSKDDIIFGFSLGAILAWLVAQIYPCRRLILASMTPHYSFKDPKIKKALIDLAGSRFVKDVIKHLTSRHKAKKKIIMYGDLEGEKADILVAKTDHELSDIYLKEINKLL